jgi:dUTPase
MSNKVFIKNSFKFSEKDSIYNIGFDLKATSMNIVGDGNGRLYKSIDYIEYDTNLCLDTLKRNSEEQLYSLVYPRSRISKYNLLLCNSVGIIDPNYRDNVKIRFKYIYQPKDIVIVEDAIYTKIDEEKIYKVGNKIAQLVFSKSIQVFMDYVPELMPSDRSGGFGSTGK